MTFKDLYRTHTASIMASLIIKKEQLQGLGLQPSGRTPAQHAQGIRFHPQNTDNKGNNSNNNNFDQLCESVVI